LPVRKTIFNFQVLLSVLRILLREDKNNRGK
jgi:hypothetical protein